MNRLKITLTTLLLGLCAVQVPAQELLTNVYGRDCESLNGKWHAIVDPYDQGVRLRLQENRKPSRKNQFIEYDFDKGMRLDVPGDWNSQRPELDLYEGTLWYGRHITAAPAPGKRRFLYFGAVSYRCRVYLNGKRIGEHEGGFTPFQLEVSDLLKEGDNFLAVEVNNRRSKENIPALSFDWWNYGGITRDVMLVSVPDRYIRDYFIRLDKMCADKIDIDVTLSEACAGQSVQVEIPELGVKASLEADATGVASGSVKVKKLTRWSPDNPKRYRVVIVSETDRVEEQIGFRNLAVKGTQIYLNDRPLFLRSISFHEEIPQRRGRAFSEADATMLLSEAKALGANMIRLAHYPQNEHTIRMAESMGFLLWEEIPIWQGIDFANDATREKAGRMIREMVTRDKNRCALAFWGVANETAPSEERNAFLRHLIKCVRNIDTTRLITAAFDLPRYDHKTKTFVMDDSFADELDVVAVNKYMGWYMAWPDAPEEIRWNVAPNQPLIFSEFGGEALCGQSGNADTAASWGENYQEKLYRDNLTMFRNVPNLAGVSPWILFDFRSPFRFHPTNQQGWNRKGLVSERGERKKAWYVMRDYYRQIENNAQ